MKVPDEPLKEQIVIIEWKSILGIVIVLVESVFGMRVTVIAIGDHNVISVMGIVFLQPLSPKGCAQAHMSLFSHTNPLHWKPSHISETVIFSPKKTKLPTYYIVTGEPNIRQERFYNLIFASNNPSLPDGSTTKPSFSKT